jgi:hypothetical protein
MMFGTLEANKGDMGRRKNMEKGLRWYEGRLVDNIGINWFARRKNKLPHKIIS